MVSAGGRIAAQRSRRAARTRARLRRVRSRLSGRPARTGAHTGYRVVDLTWLGTVHVIGVRLPPVRVTTSHVWSGIPLTSWSHQVLTPPVLTG